MENEQHSNCVDGRFEAAIARIDWIHAQDPEQAGFEGADWPAELVYARRMSAWLERMSAGAGEALRLAARCQHLRRWAIPRESYPADRLGYLRWRTEQGRQHAQLAGELLRGVGYDEPVIERVQSLLRKEQIKQDPEMQLLEDVICLVFLENHLAEFARRKNDPDKMTDILRKTWRKMSEQGRSLALQLPLIPEVRELVGRALGG